MARSKFGTIDNNGEPVAYDYGDIYFRQQYNTGERLVIGPSHSQIELLDELAASFPTERYYVLYVLLLSHTKRLPGRYQSPLIQSHEDLQLFIWTFQNFLEGDGRHHLWIATPDSRDMLIYDQHNVIFAYGNLDAFESILTNSNYRQQEFWFPCPHAHCYDPANSSEEDRILAYFDWQRFDLQSGDEWD